MKAVIMAGGKGTRFWPRSVESKPKQFLALTSGDTMLQLTYQRFRHWLPAEKIYVVTTKQYAAMVHVQLPELTPDRIIIEPASKDTGPCIALAALYFLGKGDNEVLVTTPSDQHIPDHEDFMNVLLKAEKAAVFGEAIITLGVVPTRPETGYGYIETLEPSDDEQVVPVRTFIEKPDMEKANDLIQQPNMYFNSGIFIWKPSTISHYMQTYQSKMWSLLSGCEGELEAAYSKLPKISVDYAILEKATTIYTIPVSFDWDDVGLWTSLERIHPANLDGNIAFGDIHSVQAENNIIYSENLKTAVVGVRDLIVVSTDHGLLICHKSKEQLIKEIIKAWENVGGGEQ